MSVFLRLVLAAVSVVFGVGVRYSSVRRCGLYDRPAGIRSKACHRWIWVPLLELLSAGWLCCFWVNCVAHISLLGKYLLLSGDSPPRLPEQSRRGCPFERSSTVVSALSRLTQFCIW